MRYTRTDSAAAAAAVLAEHVPLVVVTCGDEGVLAVDAAAGRTVHLPAVPTTAVDPTGAGDVFVATFMAGERHGWDLDTRLRCAALGAAVSVSTLGGAISAPRLPDLSDFVTAHDLPGDWSFLPTPPLAPSERTEPR
jgi:sugar/nucleoside kinase (ribokinase family)